MGWSLGWDGSRFIGYGVVAYCDCPGCFNKIDRGLSYKCDDIGYDDNGDEINGCGGFFCSEHRTWKSCDDCDSGMFSGWGPDYQKEHPDWLTHVLTDESWEEWRNDPENHECVKRYQNMLEKYKEDGYEGKTDSPEA